LSVPCAFSAPLNRKRLQVNEMRWLTAACKPTCAEVGHGNREIVAWPLITDMTM
jgi:hypothetical protein